MRVSLFNQFGALNSPPVFKAIADGLSSIGIKHDLHNTSADMAVIWSMVWSGRMRANQAIWQEFRNTHRPVLVVEVGLLNRGRTWKLGINGTGNTANFGYGELDTNRADRLGVKLQPWTNSGSDIVIATQRADSEQWAGQPPLNQWLIDVVENLRRHTDRHIRIRPHPRFPVIVPQGCSVDRPLKILSTYDNFNFEQQLSNVWAVVNWNSGPGSQAIIAGVPAFVGPTSLAAGVGNTEWSQIESPNRPDRSQWLNQLSHTEWTTEEIATGGPLLRLINSLHKS